MTGWVGDIEDVTNDNTNLRTKDGADAAEAEHH